MHPDDMSPVYDIVHELESYPTKYDGDSWLSIRSLPSYLRTNLDRVRAHTSNYSSLSKVGCCAIAGGLGGIGANEEIRQLIKLRSRLGRMPANADPYEYEDAIAWFRSFTIAVPNPTTYPNRRLNISLTEQVKQRLHQMSDGLGLTQSTLAGLAIMAVLADQPETLKGHREMMAELMDSLVDRIRRRRRVGEFLLETFDG